MGAWGVKATESDYGLNLLDVIEERYLRERNYERFDVGEIVELLKTHITEQIRKDNREAPQEDIEFYVGINFPGSYDQAVLLVSELLAGFFSRGKIVIDVYENGKSEPTRKKISNVIYTQDNLSALLTDLQTVLSPDRALYRSWEESEYFHKWRSHIQRLSNSLQNQIGK
jgi:hypothetical protein